MAAANTRVTQAVLEVSSTPNGTARLTQSALEVSALPNGTTRLTQVVFEVSARPFGTCRLTQVVFEVSYTSAAVPTHLTAAGSCDGTITLLWNLPPNYTSFVISRGTASGGPYTQIGTSSTATYTDSPPSPTATYYYAIQTIFDGSYSQYSAEASGTAASPPAAPASVTITGQMPSFIIQAPPVARATSYNLYRGTTTGGETLYQPGLSTPYWSDTVSGLGATSLYYEFTAVNACGESARSAEVSWIPTPADCASWGESECPGETSWSGGTSPGSTWSGGGTAPSTGWSSGGAPKTPWASG